MSKNITSLIFEEVSKTNKNRYNITKEVLEEDSYSLNPRFDSRASFYNKATVDENNGEYTLYSYGTPIVKVANGNFEFLCDESALTHTTMRHIRDFLKQMDYEYKINLSGKDYPITRKWVIDHLNKTSDLEESAKVLTEAPEDDEEFELNDEVPQEEAPIEAPTEELPEEPVEDEMSNDEVQEEAQEDEEDTIKDDIEQPFYATVPEYDELREVLVDLDYRLFLINDNMVCIGRLNGPDIEFLTSNRPENTETEPSEQNDKAEEIEDKAEEDGEQAFEYKWIKAPDTFDKFLNQVNVVYLSPDMSEEDREQYAGIEASHESVMDFLMNELPEDKKEEKEEEEEPVEELPAEPTEETDTSMEEPIEEPTENEEEKDEKEEEK